MSSSILIDFCLSFSSWPTCVAFSVRRSSMARRMRAFSASVVLALTLRESALFCITSIWRLTRERCSLA